jgi:hypothetical protein
MALKGFPIKKRLPCNLVFEKLDMMIEAAKLIYEPVTFFTSLSDFSHLKRLGSAANGKNKKNI